MTKFINPGEGRDDDESPDSTAEDEFERFLNNANPETVAAFLARMYGEKEPPAILHVQPKEFEEMAERVSRRALFFAQQNPLEQSPHAEQQSKVVGEVASQAITLTERRLGDSTEERPPSPTRIVDISGWRKPEIVPGPMKAAASTASSSRTPLGAEEVIRRSPDGSAEIVLDRQSQFLFLCSRSGSPHASVGVRIGETVIQLKEADALGRRQLVVERLGDLTSAFQKLLGR